MTFGVCAPSNDSVVLLAQGFDYVEPGAHDLAPDGPDLYATNLFFPGGIRLFGPDRTAYREIAEATIRNAAGRGVRLMVLGSGGARRSPIDEDPIFLDVAAELSEMATAYGITLAPESLNRKETNVGVDLARLAQGLDGRGVAYTADSYHVLVEWDLSGRTVDLDVLWREQIPSLPAHVHVGDLARTDARRDDPMLIGFAARLKELGYDAGVSYEGRLPDDPARLAADLRALFAS